MWTDNIKLGQEFGAAGKRAEVVVQRSILGVSQLWHGCVTIVSWVSQLWHTYVNPEILVLISDDWQYKSTNTTVKKKNQIPSLSMLELI